jgi:1-acyl-sn-glycerol-3-phosphate acyltransferase
VYCSNHASLFDIPVVLATIPDNIRIMYKRELGTIPVFGWCLRMSPFIPVDRSDARTAMEQIERTVHSMRHGAGVLVFPEGTRSPDGTLGAFKRGAFSLASQSGKPIVPVALVGTASILPARGTRLQGGTVHCYVGMPIVMSASASRAEQQSTMQQVHDVIEQCIFAHDH